MWFGSIQLDSEAHVPVVLVWFVLIDDTADSLLGADANALDVIRRLASSLEPPVGDVRCLDGCLGVELGRTRNFEEDVFHHVRTVRALELEGPLEE